MKTNDYFLIELLILEYLEPLNCVQIIVILCANKLGLTYVKMKLPTNYWLTNHLTVCKQMSSGSFKMLSTKSVYKSYIFNIYE